MEVLLGAPQAGRLALVSCRAEVSVVVAELISRWWGGVCRRVWSAVSAEHLEVLRVVPIGSGGNILGVKGVAGLES